MNHREIINRLEKNGEIFEVLFHSIGAEVAHWREAEDKWCLLEIVNHLYDEEREDFRYRVIHCLETPDEHMPGIRPQHWVTERKYMERNFEESVGNFLKERVDSIKLLRSLENPAWNSQNDHRYLGLVTAEFFLANWVAHDLLHLRQINRLLFKYYQSEVECSLEYAGDW